MDLSLLQNLDDLCAMGLPLLDGRSGIDIPSKRPRTEEYQSIIALEESGEEDQHQRKRAREEGGSYDLEDDLFGGSTSETLQRDGNSKVAGYPPSERPSLFPSREKLIADVDVQQPAPPIGELIAHQDAATTSKRNSLERAVQRIQRRSEADLAKARVGLKSWKGRKEQEYMNAYSREAPKQRLAGGGHAMTASAIAVSSSLPETMPHIEEDIKRKTRENSSKKAGDSVDSKGGGEVLPLDAYEPKYIVGCRVPIKMRRSVMQKLRERFALIYAGDERKIHEETTRLEKSIVRESTTKDQYRCTFGHKAMELDREMRKKGISVDK